MPPARSYSRKSPDERKNQLIESAIVVLAEGGLAAFTVERIARHAGISKGLISHYFDGKNDLLAHAYQAMASDFDEIAEIYFGADDVCPRYALNAYIDAYFKRAGFGRGQLRAWLAVWEATVGNETLTSIHKQRQETFLRHLERLIAAAARDKGRDVDAAAVATMLEVMLTGLWLEWCLSSGLLSADEAVETAKAFLAQHLGEA